MKNLLTGIALALTASACIPRSVPNASHHDFVHLTNVPFYQNNTDQCGPAALASVLNYWGKSVEPEQLKSDVYMARLQGTLPLDMQPAVESRGLSARIINGTFEDLKQELRSNRPVVAYLDFGTRKHPIGHFAVVIGFDEKKQGLYLHSGPRKNTFAAYRRFDRGWKDTNRWMMMVAPSEQTSAWIDRHGTTPAPELLKPRLSAPEHFQLGQIYEEQGLQDLARVQYESALKVDKKLEPALLALGNLSFNGHDLESAKKYYRRILKRNPGHSGANNNLAMVYLEESDLNRAATHALRAVSIRHEPQAYETLAQIYMKQERYTDAQQALDQAIEGAAGNSALLKQLRQTELVLASRLD